MLCDGKVWLVPGYHVVSVLCIVSPGVSLYSEVCRILQRRVISDQVLQVAAADLQTCLVRAASSLSG